MSLANVEPTTTTTTDTKIDSNHNSSIGSFNQDLVSETSTMSDGENSVATAVEGSQSHDYIIDDNEEDHHHIKD